MFLSITIIIKYIQSIWSIYLSTLPCTLQVHVQCTYNLVKVPQYTLSIIYNIIKTIDRALYSKTNNQMYEKEEKNKVEETFSKNCTDPFFISSKATL